MNRLLRSNSHWQQIQSQNSEVNATQKVQIHSKQSVEAIFPNASQFKSNFFFLITLKYFLDRPKTTNG